jgi:hypothetical protein
MPGCTLAPLPCQGQHYCGNWQTLRQIATRPTSKVLSPPRRSPRRPVREVGGTGRARDSSRLILGES